MTMAQRKHSGAKVALTALPLLVLAGTPAMAALSPLYQSMREIEAILRDGHLVQAFANQEAIMSITTPSRDVYEVKTKSCTLTVNVVDAPPKPGEEMMVGPRQFALEFADPVCR